MIGVRLPNEKALRGAENRRHPGESLNDSDNPILKAYC